MENELDLSLYRARMERALAGASIADLLGRYRQIAGPQRYEEYRRLAEEARALIEVHKQPSGEQLEALESAIREQRPSLLSRAGTLDALDERTAAAFPAWEKFRELVQPLLYSIGRLDRAAPGRSEGEHQGTGFLVSDRLILTCAHVLDDLTSGTRVLDPRRAEIHFQLEYRVKPTEKPVAIKRVEAVHPTDDLALLEISPLQLGASRAALAFDDQPAERGTSVVTVGYPGDSPAPFFTKVLFGDNFGLKRAAPGELIAETPGHVSHDCTTLAGNSGSPVISMTTGKVLGVHCSGQFLYRNQAVEASIAKTFVERHRA